MAVVGNQNRAPLVEALDEHIKRNYLSFHMPGHKGGLGTIDEWRALLGQKALSLDLTELEGLGDLHHLSGPIKKAQELAAALMGTRGAYFLVNGVTVGIQAAIMTMVREKGRVIVPRHAHRSIYGAMILSGVEPVYVKPFVHPEWGFPIGVDLCEVKTVIEGHTNVGCLIMIHPTYHGLTSDLASIVSLANKHDIKVLVDEAHGAHFIFSPNFPVPAIKCGAAIAVQGWHKTMGSLTQSGICLLNDLDLNVFDYLTILQSTSPSYLLMGSLDAARKNWAEHGRQMAEELLDKACWFRDELKEVNGIICLDQNHLNCSVLKETDVTRVVLNGWEIGLNGFQLARELRESYGIQPEMAEYAGVTLMFTIGDTKEKLNRLLKVLKDIAKRFPKKRLGNLPQWFNFSIPELALSPGEALRAKKRAVIVEDAVGSVAGEFICPYPPGIPLVVPGEIITKEVGEFLRDIKIWDGKVQGPADPSGKTLRVIE